MKAMKSMARETLRNLGVLYAKDLVKLSIENAEAIVEQYEGEVRVHKFVCEDSQPTSKPYHFAEDKLPDLRPIYLRTETVIVDTTNPFFSLRNNHLIDPRRRVIYQPDLEFKALPVASERLSEAQKLKGTVAYLSNTDTNNYYHWMAWIIPLVHTYQKVLDPSEVDYFYIGSGEIQNFKRETLERVGIRMNQIIQHGCCADRVLAAVDHRVGYGGGSVPLETFLFIRGLFSKEIEDAVRTTPRKRIYVTRGKVTRRKVLNEAEVIDVLSKYGFEPVAMDGLTVSEQATLFASADAIVSAHGAALTNLFFAQPNTRVLEIFPHNYSVNLYHVLTSHSQSEYSYLIGEDFPTEKQGNEIDLLVNIDKLKKICAMKFSYSSS